MLWAKPLLALILSLYSLALVSCVDRSKQPRLLLPFDPEFRSKGIACNEDWVVVFGDYRPLNSPATKAAFLRAGLSSTGWHRAYLGHDRTTVASNGLTRDGALFALVSSHTDEPRLLWSTNQGLAWEAAPDLPKEVLGVGFADSKIGYAWGLEDVYSTRTGGSEWTGRPLSGVFSLGSPWPTVDTRGDLWVIRSVPVLEGNREVIIRIDKHLAVFEAMVIKDHVDRVVSGDSGLRLLGRKDRFGPAQFSEVSYSSEVLEYALVVDLGIDLPVELVAAGNFISAILSNTSNGSDRYLLASSNAGRTWVRVDQYADSPDAVCVTVDGEIWIAGRRGLWHLPWNGSTS